MLPIKVGVTGGIGAGKSVVCNIFEALGIAVYNADTRAKALLTEDAELKRQICGHFGDDSYLPDGQLNRSYLAETVFDDQEKLAFLNSLVHPRVGFDFDKWLQAHSEEAYVVKEAALIFEAGAFKSLDAVVTVSAPLELRVRRTIIRDEHRSRKQIEDIIAKQLPEEERLKRANYKIINDDTTLVVPQVLKLHKQFLRMATESK